MAASRDLWRTTPLSILNESPKRLEGPQYLHELVQSHLVPGGSAAIDFLDGDNLRRTITYDQLRVQSARLAERIRFALQGSKPDQNPIVPVLLPQSPELYISLLAILRAGGAFCPLSLDAPLERVRFILDEVAANVVITTSSLSSKIPVDYTGRKIIRVNEDNHDDDKTDADLATARPLRPGDLAYVMYTSGSSGTPKGVGISHDAATQSLLAHDRHIPQFSRFLQFAAPTFDVSVFEIFFPLSRGATVVCCDRTLMLNDLPGVLKTMEVDACELTPTVAGGLLHKRENAPSLRLLLTIGEMLTEHVVKEFGGSDGRPSMLWAMYGPTEATIHCTLQPALQCDSIVGNIGLPLDTVSSFILEIPDECDSSAVEVVPVGEVGELLLGGHQLATGYLGRPEQTDAAFVDTPYGRLYRTGDRARVRSDGTLECLGRVSAGQVKLRGQRIELGEIEQASMRTPGCRSAVASVIDGVLVAFCAAKTGGCTSTAVLESCRDWLPGFMVPGDVVIMEAFPSLPSGKTDRKRLELSYEKTRNNTHQRCEVTFKDELERELCLAASQVLEIEVHSDSNVSALGMDSLMAIRYASSLRQTGIDVTAHDVLLSRTIANIHSRVITRQADAVSEAHGDGIPKGISPLELNMQLISDTAPSLRSCLDDIEVLLPCTSLQVSMLVETSKTPGAYCNTIELEFPPECDANLICQWFVSLAERNEILRTSFLAFEETFIQVVWKGFSHFCIQQPDALDEDMKSSFNDTESLLWPFKVTVVEAPSTITTRVLLRMHHSIYDGWTIDLLLKDLNILLRRSNLAPRPQFRDVLKYYTSTSFSLDSDRAREFWAEHLLGFRPVPFPRFSASARESGNQPSSASQAFDFTPKAVKTALRPLECSSDVLFQACLGWLCGSLFGIDDVVIGVVTSGRTIPIHGAEGIMGPCIAVAPLRTRLSAVRSVRELLDNVQSTNRNALANSVLPLQEIKNVARISPTHQLFDILYVYQESLYSRGREDFPIREVSHQDYLETKLLVEIEPRLSDFKCSITYHPDMFPPEQVAVMMKELHCLTRYFLNNLESDLSSVQEAFSGDLLSVYNPSPSTFCGTADLAKSVESIAAKFPTKEAVSVSTRFTLDSAQSISVDYDTLNRTANGIGRLLLHIGASEGQSVAIVMEKSLILYFGILGIVKAGCAYLPLLPSTPISRMNTIFEQAGVKICLVNNESFEKLRRPYPEQSSWETLNLETTDFEHFPCTNLNVKPDPSRVVNIIYTSGSTGLPKGVSVTHLNIVSNLDVLSNTYPVTEDSRILQACSQAFDVSVFEIFFAWTTGMCLCTAPNDVLFEDIDRAIQKMRITHLSMTPTVAALVTPQEVPRVQMLVTAGEPMTQVIAQKWAGRLYQGYGPSETTNICTVKKMVTGDAIQHLGWSCRNTSSVVLYPDSEKAVPYGAVGEFCFGGDQVAHGYLNMPELTSAKFINHPKYGRLYRTGDLGRMLPDGSLVIIGRMDDQVKLHGQRIELDEIKAVMADVGADAVTVLMGGSEEDPHQQLITFYMSNELKAHSRLQLLQNHDLGNQRTRKIFGMLQLRLPAYMLPSYVIPIAEIPRTSSGKIDKTRLRSMFSEMKPEDLERFAADSEQGSGETELSETEYTIAQCLSVTLGLPRSQIGRWTPFAHLGLDSISAISVAKDLRQALGQRITISSVLRNPCVAKLAQTLAVRESNPDIAHVESIFSVEFKERLRSRFKLAGKAVDQIFPCMPLQEAMLAASAGGRRGTYLNRQLFRLNIDIKTMAASWREMCARHGILRTCFVSTEILQHPIAQVVLRDWEPKIRHLQSTTKSIDECIADQVATTSDAVDSLEPPMSLAFICGDQDHYVSFICHHAMYDGVAVSILLQQVEKASLGLPIPPPVDYAPFLREALSLPAATDGFWKGYLKDFRLVRMPRSTEGLGNRDRDILTDTLKVSLSRIKEALRELGISLLSLCQASWATTLAVVTRSEDVCFGNVASGRSVGLDRLDELVAPCFNTNPIRAPIADLRRNIDLMKYFDSLKPKLSQYQFTPLRRIQGFCSQDGNHLFDTLLLLQRPAHPLDRRVWTLERDDGDMDVPLVCELTPNSGVDCLHIKFHYDCNLFSPDLISFVSRVFQSALALCLQFPGSHILSVRTLPSQLNNELEGLKLDYDDLVVRDRGDLLANVRPGEWTKPEMRIRSVLANISTVPESRIHRDTTIYQLGLDSISAVQVASGLRNQGLEVFSSDVIAYPTCAQLSEHLNNNPREKSQPLAFDFEQFRTDVRPVLTAYGVNEGSVEAVLPCTPVQEAMLTAFLQSSGKAYFNYLELQLHDSVAVSELRQAWIQASNYHHILRTGFVPVEHRNFSFAMIQYTPAYTSLPNLDVQDPAGFNVGKWQLDSAHRALTELENPPWNVLIAQDSQNSGPITMHIAIHHALYDANSVRLLLGDVSKILRNEIIRPLPTTHAVVSEILQQSFSNQVTQKAFWEEMSKRIIINKFPILTPLKVDGRSVVVESLGSASFTDLETTLQKLGFSVQAAIQAAWTRTLSSYLGEPSVVFGVVFSGRNTELLSKAAFPCISTLPAVSENKLLNRELLEASLKSISDLHKRLHTPLAKIQKWTGQQDTRLFDTLVVYQKHDRSIKSEPEPWTLVDDLATADYPLSLEVEPGNDDKLIYRLTFFDNVVPREQAWCVLQQFDAILRHLVYHSEESEDDLYRREPETFSVTPPETVELPSDIKFLHEFVEARAKESPDRVALHFVHSFNETGLPVGNKWTYSELNAFGNRVASILQPSVKVGGIVVVHFDKCPEAFFAILGVLKAGCAFVALDPGAPPARKEVIVEDSGASALLTHRNEVEHLGFDTVVPVFGIDLEFLEVMSAGNASAADLAPSDRCYCLYTSGTTGTPKGCEITHENAVQAMLAFQHLFSGHWDENSKWLQFASFHFDVSVLEQYWSWSVGITLVSATRDLILENLAGTISHLNITHIDLTPSLARLLRPEEVPSLRKGVFITGGESLKQEILDVWGDEGVIYNAYGPTEATIGVTMYSRVPKNGRTSNIGKQFPNVGSYVLKQGTDTPVLRGGVGELCVSGKLVGKGYLNRGDLTAERFPIILGERVYRTGDFVRILHGGCFEFLGRADDQVKLRGQRLEIGEINHAIRASVKMVADVATLVVQNPKLHKELLVSFIVAIPATSEPREEDLHVVHGPEAVELCLQAQNACRQILPGYMVPTYVLCLPFMPLSANNKAEVKALKRLFCNLSREELLSLSSAAGGKTARMPIDTVQKILKALTSMKLCGGDQNIHLNTTMFDLGIDSISVLQLSRCLKREGLYATPATILRHPRVEDLANILEPQSSATTAGAVSAAHQLVQGCQHRHRALACKELQVGLDEIAYIAPCSALQQGMISRSRAAEGAYFSSFKFELAPDTSLAKLRDAWQVVIDECDILRTKFVETTDGFVQVALKAMQLVWHATTVSSRDELEAAIYFSKKQWVDSNRKSMTSLLRALAVDLGPHRILVLHIFHGLYDAASFGLMADRVVGIYHGCSISQRSPTFLSALLHGPLQSCFSCKKFWEEHLPVDVVEPLPRLSESPTPYNISKSITLQFSSLDALRRSLNVTHQAVVLALWCSVLRRHMLRGCVTMGVIVSGRAMDLDGIEEVIGPLFNTLPFHASLVQNETWSSLVRKCHEFNTATLPLQHVPLRDIQKWCSSGKPLFDTLFSFQFDNARRKMEPTPWTRINSDINPDFPLALEATLTDDSDLHLLLVAQRGVADDEALSNLLREFEQAARAATLHPHAAIGGTTSRGAVPLVEADRSSGLDDKASSDPPIPFSWTEQAFKIRTEIAQLAKVSTESVHKDTSLLSLGLDSIDSIKLSARLKTAGINLSTGQLMKAQKIVAFIDIIESQSVNGIMSVEGSNKFNDTCARLKQYILEHHISAETVLPPTPLQESMVAEMIQSDFRRYLNHDVLEVAPGLDIDRLKEAWKFVVQQSPILRTVFIQIDDPQIGVAYAQVVKNLPLIIRELNLGSVDEIGTVIEDARRRASRGRGQRDLLQVTITRAQDRRFFMLSISHALYDGWSLELLHRDVQRAYHGHFMPRASYTRYLEKILDSSSFEARQFWSGYLNGVHRARLPEASDKSNNETVTRAEATSSVSLVAITDFCRHQGLSLQVLGQACWAAILATKTRYLDVTFGVVLSGRDTEEAEELLFPTMNTVPIRAILHGTVSTFLYYMQANMTNISQFQHFPLRMAQALAGRNRENLFDTLFIQQRASSHSSHEILLKSVAEYSAIEYPVCVEMEMMPDSLLWRVAGGAQSIDEQHACRLLHELDVVLEYCINKSDGDLLNFQGFDVSVCGLPVFHPRDDTLNDDISVELESPRNCGRGDWSIAEEHIRDVLAEVAQLPLESVQKEHNIYNLGLDSISGIKVRSLLEKRGIILAVRDMIKARSIQDMAALASGPNNDTFSSTARTASSGYESIPLELVQHTLDGTHLNISALEAVLPASSMQIHILSAWQNSGGAMFYPRFRYKLSGRVSTEGIRSAWLALVEELPILRTSFIASDNQDFPFVQVIYDRRAVSNIPLATDNERWSGGGAGDMSQPFVTFDASRSMDNVWDVNFRFHHALYDAISLNIIVKRFQTLCAGEAARRPPEPDLSRWSQFLSTSRGAAETRKQFWTHYLQRAKTTPLSRSGRRDVGPKANHSEMTSCLKRAAIRDISSIKSTCKTYGLSIQALFFAAYASVLADSQPKVVEDVVFGVYLANRSGFDGLESLPFPTLSLVPLRVGILKGLDLIRTATLVQDDLNRIGELNIVSVGLWDVKDWTGVEVGSFVNFLDFSGKRGGHRERKNDKEAITLEEVRQDEPDQEIETRKDVVPDTLTTHPWLIGNPVRYAYPAAVDIEASIAGKALDIGVFGPSNLLDDDGAAGIIADIVIILEGI